MVLLFGRLNLPDGPFFDIRHGFYIKLVLRVCAACHLMIIIEEFICLYPVRPARMRSNFPLLEPGPPRFFWWYENSE